jgi:hypothetical protein
MKFLLVDDHALIREALRGVVWELVAGASILEASHWGEARGCSRSIPTSR